MPPSPRTSDDFATLLRYTRWANAQVLSVLRDAGAAPERARALLSHLLRTQDVWYGRVEGTDHAHLDFWATDTLPACAERAEASARRWRTLLHDTADDDLDRSVSYTNSKGTAYDTSLRDILTHVFNHGTHHRAQIALLLREAGVAPPVTDYIYFVRNG